MKAFGILFILERTIPLKCVDEVQSGFESRIQVVYFIILES